jgi:hypothetical protein
MDKNFFDCRIKANTLLQGSRPVLDPELQNFLSNLSYNINFTEYSNLKVFTNEFSHWLNSSTNIDGLEQLEPDFSSGTTQSFDSFYYRHRHRRFRCFVGEYFYHLKSWIATNTNWSFITDNDPLAPNDALILSLPFCDTGNLYENYQNVLDECEKLKIPVLIDCCYYTLTDNTKLNFKFKCIDTVAFSLSKSFPVAHLRIGVRYTSSKIEDGQKLHDKINYNNVFSAYIGLEIIKHFPSNFLYNKYHQQQTKVCDFFNIEPSQSVIFAVGDSTWDIYSRKNLIDSYQLQFDHKLFKNRICLNSIFENWNSFQSYQNEYTTFF